MKPVMPRDFIETKKGLLFAALNRDIAFLRYYPHPQGDRERKGVRYKKIDSTESSFEYLEKNFPEHIIIRSSRRLQHCPPQTIQLVYSPIDKLEDLKGSGDDSLAIKCQRLSSILEEIPENSKGVTGSILVDLHKPSSDIDFVVYGGRNFQIAREVLSESADIKPLNERQWQRYYEKRFPRQRSLSFEEFFWHERRKSNIGLIDGTMFNLLLVDDNIKLEDSTPAGQIKTKCKVMDSTRCFDVPSVYKVDHDIVDEIISYTHTYAGQARKGEAIEVSGVLEKKQTGFRIVVGTTREAEGEYIKVLEPKDL